MSYYLSLFTDKELALYRSMLPKTAAARRSGRQISESVSGLIDGYLGAAAAAAGNKVRQKKTHQRELIQEYLDNGGIPGRYGEDIPDDPKCMKEEDLAI